MASIILSLSESVLHEKLNRTAHMISRLQLSSWLSNTGSLSHLSLPHVSNHFYNTSYHSFLYKNMKYLIVTFFIISTL